MSDFHDSSIQMAAAREAERSFKRARRDSRKVVPANARHAINDKNTRDKGRSFELPIREMRAMNET